MGAVFSARGEPTRRHLLESLTRGRATISGVAGDLPLSRQAVTKHLETLRRAGLVRGERAGGSLYFELTPEAMREPVRWMAEVGAEWEESLAGFERLLSDEVKPLGPGRLFPPLAVPTSER